MFVQYNATLSNGKPSLLAKLGFLIRTAVGIGKPCLAKMTIKKRVHCNH